MATLADSGSGTSRAGALTRFVDRWIYAFTAALFVAAVLAGFIPDSIRKVAAVQTGARPPFAAIMHIHAVLMGSWLLLLLAQTTLMATGRRALHRQLGIAAFVLAPLLVIAGLMLVPENRGEMANAILHGTPAVAAKLRPAFGRSLDIVLVQIRIGILFAALIALGLAARRHDPALHKRLMILGTAAALPAATDRILWLPSTLPGDPLTTELWPLALIAPMFVWDLYRLGRVHRAYILYLGISLVLAVPSHLLWGTPWWRATAMRLLGISGI